MACNTPPTFANVDCAVLARCQFIPFESTFSDKAPASEALQFEKLVFKADRDFNAHRIQTIGRVLVYLFLCRHVTARMDSPTYSLEIPRRMHLEAQMHMHDVTVFRSWCRAFLRPASVHQGLPISLSLHRILREAMAAVSAAAQEWDAAHPDLAQCAWWHLPEDVRGDVRTPGSPAWVRCQTVHMHRLQYQCLFRGDAPDQSVVLQSDRHLNVVCPFVDSHVVIEAFNRFRRSGRGAVGRAVNTHNTFVRPLSRAHAEPEAVAREQEEDCVSAVTGGHGGDGNRVGLNTRMHLDPGLIRNIIREVADTEPFDRFLVGFHLIDQRNGGIDNLQPTSTFMNSAMQVIVEDWYRRYLVPLPYHTSVDGGTIREAMQRASVQTVLSDASHGRPVPTRVARPVVAVDGPDRDTGPVYYRPLHHPAEEPEVAVDVDEVALSQTSEVGHFPACRVLGMPCAVYPEFLCPDDYRSDKDPLRRQHVHHWRDSMALMVADTFYTASELQQEIARHRLKHFHPGFTEAGQVQAIRSPREREEILAGVGEDRLTFYLGEQTRVTL